MDVDPSAIADRDPREIASELGDLLFQVVFLAELLAEAGHSSLQQVAQSTHQKMVARHPHVFDESHPPLRTAQEVERAWQVNKRASEKRESALSGVPSGLPALLAAHRLATKAAGSGFDWNSPEQVLDKVSEEVELGVFELSAGENRISAVVVGANDQAKKSYMFGMDQLIIKRVATPEK